MRETTISAISFQSCHHCFRKVYVLLSIILFTHSFAFTQRPQYHITADLDPSTQTLEGSIDIIYTNLSATPLDKIGIHLWPNAYSRTNSAFARQQLNMGNLEFHNADPDEMGGLTAMNFSSHDHQILFVPDKENIDIGWLILDQPLAPNDTIHISSPFLLKIPSDFSRLGKSGSTYQMTQWYPHIAVHDDEGWHMMPYLDYGEFFNDFANYEVTLSVPKKYTIAATGVLSSRVEHDQHTEWTFIANNVIDFAWFASPDFHHQQLTVDVGGEQPVELNLYTQPGDSAIWKRALEYAQRALQFYSHWLGPYPYPQMSVVSTPLSVGGGMEYPMLSHIGPVSDTTDTDIVIAHEIGHTWLYGILANDERTHPWMDEGLNTFIENQYTAAFHPFYDEYLFPSAFTTAGSMSANDLLIHTDRVSNILQPPASDPETQQGNQYYLSAYTLPATGLEMMESIHGVDIMKDMFRKYYAEHKFTHVAPEELQASFEKVCDCDLDWYFDQWIHHAHEVDYRIENLNIAKKEITIVNHSGVVVPVRLSTYRGDRRIMDHWIDGFEGSKIMHLDDRFDKVQLYDQFMGINKMRTANIRPSKMLPRVSVLPQIESYDTPTLSVTPFFGTNITDGLMPGIAITSGLFPQQRFKFVIAPMYGLESKKLRGHATLRYINDVKKGPFDKYLLSFGMDHFGYNLDTHYYFRDHYFKWEPTLALRFNSSTEHTHLKQWLKYRYAHIDQYYGRGLIWEIGYYEEEKRSYGVHELSWQLRSDYILKPFEARVNMQAGKGFVRLNLTYKQQFAGRTKHLGTWVHGYAGWLPVHDQPDANVVFTFTGQASSDFFSKDYMYDEWLGGRNAESGIFAHQVFEKDAHLKTLATNGLGDQWMFGAGISQAFPFRFLHFYMDAAVFPSALTEEVDLSYSGGAAIVLLKDVFEIYLPLLESNDIRESLTYEVRDMWFERVTFIANIKLANPTNLVDRKQFGY